jgi:hypothetical protein
MAFNLKSRDEEKIVLIKDGFSWFSVFVFGSSCCAFIWHGVNIIKDNLNSSGGLMFGFILIFFGIVPLYVVYGNYRDTARHAKELIFHLKKGYIEVVSSHVPSQHAFVPFKHFSKLAISEERRSSGKRSYTIYCLDLIMKDGDKWRLLETSYLIATEEMAKLNAELDFAKEPIELPEPKLSTKLTCFKTTEKDSVEWALANWSSPATSLVFLLLFGVFFSFLESVDILISVFGFIFILVFIAILINFIFSAYLLVTNINVMSGISISSTRIYFYKKNEQGRIRITKEVLISNVESVHNSMKENMISDNVSLYINEKNEPGFEDLNLLVKIKKIIKTLHHLRFSNISFVESLELERWIQQKIKERSNFEVL